MAESEQMSTKLKFRRIIVLVVGLVLAGVVIAMSGSLFESNNADEILVVQSPGGDLTVHSDPGAFKWQGFGRVTHYQKRDQLWFDANAAHNADGENAGPIQVRFNDAAEAQISGSVAWEMPLDVKQVLDIHSRYGTHASLKQQLMRTVVEKSVYMTGPLMSSRESYAERKNDLISLIGDQIANGIYETTTKQVQQEDPISGQMKTVVVVEVKLGDDGRPMRQEASPLTQFGIRSYNLSINLVDYDDAVDKQIAQQQALTQQVQTAMAEAREAEQRKITTEQQGQADAAKAKWTQEVIKATEVTAAEQRKAVAALDAETADLRRIEQIRLGQGEAERKRLVMEADGALDLKLQAYREVNRQYADAISKMQVPTVVMGGEGDVRSIDGAAALVSMLTAKTAKDLSLDMGITGQAATKK